MQTYDDRPSFGMPGSKGKSRGKGKGFDHRAASGTQWQRENRPDRGAAGEQDNGKGRKGKGWMRGNGASRPSQREGGVRADAGSPSGNSNRGCDADEEKQQILDRVAAFKKEGFSKLDLLEIVVEASPTVLANTEVAQAILGACGSLLKNFSEASRNDFEVVLWAVENDGSALSHASVAMRGNKEVVLRAVQTSQHALRFASKELQSDAAVVLQAVRSHGSALQFASDDLRADRAVVLEACKQNGSALRFASEALRADGELVLEAVGSCPTSLEHVSEEHRDNKEIVLTAVRRNHRTFKFASPTLLADREVFLTALAHGKDGSEVVTWARPKRIDKDIALLAYRFAKEEGPPGRFESDCPWETFQHKIWQLWSRDPERPGQAAEHAGKDGKEWQAIVGASKSSLAAEGQSGPTVSAKISNHDQNGNFLCECSLLSGTSFPCEVSVEDGRSDPCNVNDLAKVLVKELPKHVQVADAADYVFLTFTKSDGEFVPVTVWDWDRPLSDFL